MTSTIPFKLSRTTKPVRISALDRVTAAFARTHHTHEAPIVGCYLCLHNVARRPLELAAAA